MAIIDYLNFLADAPRVEAFRRAIAEVVTPDKVVLDLGTGIGTYALFAARAGARVYAVEVGPAIDVARELAVENGLAERIEFLRGRAERLQPPRRADVLVFEDFAPHLFAPETAELLEEIGRRWLTPGAVAIPRRIRVLLGPRLLPPDVRRAHPLSRRRGLRPGRGPSHRASAQSDTPRRLAGGRLAGRAAGAGPGRAPRSGMLRAGGTGQVDPGARRGDARAGPLDRPGAIGAYHVLEPTLGPGGRLEPGVPSAHHATGADSGGGSTGQGVDPRSRTPAAGVVALERDGRGQNPGAEYVPRPAPIAG